jgi:hypothetical protein
MASVYVEEHLPQSQKFSIRWGGFLPPRTSEFTSLADSTWNNLPSLKYRNWALQFGLAHLETIHPPQVREKQAVVEGAAQLQEST